MCAYVYHSQIRFWLQTRFPLTEIKTESKHRQWNVWIFIKQKQSDSDDEGTCCEKKDTLGGAAVSLETKKAGSSCRFHVGTPPQGWRSGLPWQQTDEEPGRRESSYLAVSSAGHVHVEDDLSVILGTVGPRGTVGQKKRKKKDIQRPCYHWGHSHQWLTGL